MIHHFSDPASDSLPGPENIVREQFPNGIVVLLRANLASASFVISGSLSAGGLYDPAEKLGLADFTATMLTHGTEEYSYIDIYERLESGAASLGFSGGVSQISFSAKALMEDFDWMLGLLAQVIRHPVFPSEQVERLRTQLLTGLSIRMQDTSEMASLAFDQLVYPGHPYSRPEDGYPETIQKIQAADMAGFHRKYFGPQGMQIALAGGFDPLVVLEKIREKFADWNNPFQTLMPPIPPAPPNKRRSQHVHIAEKQQVDLVMGSAGPSRTSSDFLAASLGNHILGQFGMMGRLGKSLREDSGIAYYASSSVSGGLGPGPWDVSAGVDPNDVERAIELVDLELKRFTSEPVSDEELADSQANYIGRLPMSFETNGGVASSLLALERYNLGLDYFQMYPAIIQSVTPEMILETAARYLDPDRIAIVSAGPNPETTAED